MQRGRCLVSVPTGNGEVARLLATVQRGLRRGQLQATGEGQACYWGPWGACQPLKGPKVATEVLEGKNQKETLVLQQPNHTQIAAPWKEFVVNAWHTWVLFLFGGVWHWDSWEVSGRWGGAVAPLSQEEKEQKGFPVPPFLKTFPELPLCGIWLWERRSTWDTLAPCWGCPAPTLTGLLLRGLG